MRRKAVVLFNLGGPDTPEAVRPFLFNLFNDSAILSLFQPFRSLLAFLIAKRREKEAQSIYAHLGGGSPLFSNTREQAKALEAVLGTEWRVFVAMRYWHPFVCETVKALKACDPIEIVLVPLYPQFSTTTTASAFKEWTRVSNKEGLHIPTRHIGCYPQEAGFIEANCALIQEAMKEETRPFRVLFSAHGLPERIVQKGDPYQSHVELSAKAIVSQLNLKDYAVCYQSKVGPLKWLSPSLEDEIIRAGQDNKGVVIVPLSFVSENSETLVELDHQYKAVAAAHHIPFYYRVPTVGTHPFFINCLAQMITSSQSHSSQFACNESFTHCFCRKKS